MSNSNKTKIPEYSIHFCSETVIVEHKINDLKENSEQSLDLISRLEVYLDGTKEVYDSLKRAIYTLNSDEEFASKGSLVPNLIQDSDFGDYNDYKSQLENNGILIVDITSQIIEYSKENMWKLHDLIIEAKQIKQLVCVCIYNTNVKGAKSIEYIKALKRNKENLRVIEYKYQKNADVVNNSNDGEKLETSFVKLILKEVNEGSLTAIPDVKKLNGIEQIMNCFEEMLDEHMNKNKPLNIRYMGTVGLLSPSTNQDWISMIDKRISEGKIISVTRIMYFQGLASIIDKHKKDGIVPIEPIVDYLAWLLRYYSITISKNKITTKKWLKVHLSKEVNAWKNGMAIIIFDNKDEQQVLLLFGHENLEEMSGLLMRNIEIGNFFNNHVSMLFEKSEELMKSHFYKAINLTSNEEIKEWPAELSNAIELFENENSQTTEQIKRFCEQYLSKKIKEIGLEHE